MNKNEIKQYKKYLFTYFFTILILLIPLISFTIYVDPFYHYHGLIGKQKLHSGDEYYQNIGIAKNFKYDSVIIGSSMTENFKVSQFEKKFGGKIVKLSLSGGYPKNYKLLFSKIFKKRKIKNIYYGLDTYVYITQAKEYNFEIPNYLYDDNYFNDVNYVLNKNVFFNKTIPIYNNEMNTNWDAIYSWYNSFTFSKEATLKNYKREEKKYILDNKKYFETLNIRLSTLTYFIKNNPNTSFYIFYPPYSILYYDLINQRGELEIYLKSNKIIMNELIKYPNVRLTSFYYDKNIIMNLNNYKDCNHYSNKISEYIVDNIDKDEYKIDKSNINRYIDESNKFFLNYDYESLF